MAAKRPKATSKSIEDSKFMVLQALERKIVSIFIYSIICLSSNNYTVFNKLKTELSIPIDATAQNGTLSGFA